MEWIYNDGGRAKADGIKGAGKSDCVCRAIAIAAELPYAEVHARLSKETGFQRASKLTKKRKASADFGINTNRKWFKEYMAELGFHWVPTMAIGQGCTTHLRSDELPGGRLVVSLSKHYAAVIDGVIHDTYNPSERGTTIYQPDYPEDQLPKKAYWLENGNGWAYSPERCVYGYWILAK